MMLPCGAWILRGPHGTNKRLTVSALGFRGLGVSGLSLELQGVDSGFRVSFGSGRRVWGGSSASFAHSRIKSH